MLTQNQPIEDEDKTNVKNVMLNVDSKWQNTLEIYDRSDEFEWIRY
jgi:hypothetical protein